MTRLAVRVLALAFLGALACRRAAGPPAAAPAPWAGDPRTCGLPGLAAMPRDTAAVRCAEWFVARNGYTDLPPVTDSTQLAVEPFEVVPSTTREWLANRHDALPRHAVLLCVDPPGGRAPQYTVGFFARRDKTHTWGTAIGMDTAFTDLRVLHGDFQPRAALADPHCHKVASVPRRR